MATKTISIEVDVYEKLRDLKNSPSESFSQVLRRLTSGPKVITGADVVRLIDEGRIPKVFSDQELDRLDEMQQEELDIARSRRGRRAG